MKGILFSMEAFFSLLAVLVLLEFVMLSQNALALKYESLYAYQLVQDVLEVGEKTGAMQNFAEFTEGNALAGAKAEKQFKEMAEQIDACITISANGKEIKANCNQKNYSFTISEERIIALNRGFERVQVSLKK
ncbi:hypothetical protein HY992_02955 [Candidatus Micrarchaeota archaeon]|nr:hypothetical protein [Candidatus Micrarchaeota archaeon]